MSYMWVSLSDCSQSHLCHLAQMMREDEELEIVLSRGVPHSFRKEKGFSVKRAEGLLARLGIPSHLKGYQYLKTSFEMSANDMGELDGITKRLYPDVARKHHTNADKVEHAIRHAIEVAWKKGDSSLQKKLFGYGKEERKRPTNLEFISGIMEYLMREPINYLS